MQIFKSQIELKKHLLTLINENTVGFVPTMGALHKGHLELIKASKKACNITICSIFVNPTQFNNINDLKNYPNTLKDDLESLKSLNCDIVYTPSVSDLYIKDEKAKEFHFGTIASEMEGKFRPGHFNGMATIVEKFFKIISPTKAFFGQKDLQQLQIVKELVKKMSSDIEIISVQTSRDVNGLALSSRNKLLSNNAKQQAALLYKCLNYCKINKEKGVTELKKHTLNSFNNHPEFELEYVEFVALKDMLPIKKWENENENAICIAAYIEGVRLIDNIIL
jgi:pantoate--beta-alanine ligase